MIETGVCSVTFRGLSPRQVASLAARGGLDAIEWGGDVHVPHGDLQVADEVRWITEGEGLHVSSYGSYYRAGVRESKGPRFGDVLRTAVTLGAPVVRIWAGETGSTEAGTADRTEVVRDTIRIADLAAAERIGIAFEYHGGTLTDTNESTLALLNEIAHENISTYWQIDLAETAARRLQGLERVLPWLSHIHVFHWALDESGRRTRRPLVEGEEEWLGYLAVLKAAGRDHTAMLEFVMDDSPGQFLEDASILRGWIEREG